MKQGHVWMIPIAFVQHMFKKGHKFEKLVKFLVAGLAHSPEYSGMDFLCIEGSLFCL